MALIKESTVKRWLADDERDVLPAVGSPYEGVTLTNTDLPPGSTVLYPRTGVMKRWTGFAWAIVKEDPDYTQMLLAQILCELQKLNYTAEAVANS